MHLVDPDRFANRIHTWMTALPQRPDRGDAPDFIVDSFADVPRWMGLA